MALVACQSPKLFTSFQELPNGWPEHHTIHFEYDNKSNDPSDLFVLVRTNPNYEFSNLYLITTMNSPSGIVVKDTLEYQMAYPDGQLMGDGLTAVKLHKLWYKEAYDFDEIGVYSFDIEHAMRRSQDLKGVTLLNGITDFGLQIEKSN